MGEERFDMGQICKGTALILMALGFIGSWHIGRVFGAGFFLFGFVSELVFCMCLYALGEIVDKLTEIAENSKPDRNNMKEIKAMYPQGIMNIQKRNK